MRKLTPGGYAYLTGSLACADRGLDASESLSDYYLSHGPPGMWFGKGATLGPLPWLAADGSSRAGRSP